MREIDKREKGLNIQADSVVVQGKVKIVDDPDEKIKLMRVLLMLHNEQAADIEAKWGGARNLDLKVQAL